MLIDDQTAVFVCAGPSLDRLSPVAWAEIERAGAVVAVNGALVGQACLVNQVSFTYAAAMDVVQRLVFKVPGFGERWLTTRAWRVAANGAVKGSAETYVTEVDELDRVEGWSNDPNEGYAGGSTAMIVGNWLCNNWSRNPAESRERELISGRTGKPIPARGFRKLAYIGLDMIPGQGGHARGAGLHQSGFSESPERDRVVRTGWQKLCREAMKRGIRVVNLTPGTGLKEIPCVDMPAEWLLE